jgi:hypothetical protein
MTGHKYRVGQKVRLHLGNGRLEAKSAFEVIRQLPNADGEFGYRVKCPSEPHERFAKESELEMARP